MTGPESYEVPESWDTKNDPDVEPFSVQALIDEQLFAERKDERPKTHWSPTDLGKCLSGVYYKRLGVKPDKEFTGRQLRVFSIGTQTEAWIISLLKKNHPYLKEQIRIEIPKWDCSGYADVELHGEIIEIKTQHSKSFWYMTKSNQGPNIQHRMQLWTYLKALSAPKGRLVYVSKDDNAMQEYPVFLGDEKLKTMVEKEFEILTTAWKEKVAPEPVPAIVDGKLNWLARYCDYHATCTGNSNWLQEAELTLKLK